VGFDAAAVAVAIIAGAVASLAGFGIGSILTPLIALKYGMRVAVAAVSVPHAIATAIRFWKIRRQVDRRLFFGFGFLNAAGALAGALLHTRLNSPLLSKLLGALLVFAGILGVTGYAGKLRFGRMAAWVAGTVSGAFGGLVGNQGSIRSAALLGLDVRRDAFVATATAIALAVDAVRMPVYIVTGWQKMLDAWPLIVCATAGVVAGTLVGVRVLRRIPEKAFRRTVSAILLAIGSALLAGIA
jgi:uncharacterized membrane protein YfcA